jgi:dUTP pyrophosphatase
MAIDNYTNTSPYILKIYVPMEQSTLRAYYRDRIDQHNSKINDPFHDSGFDLAFPKNLTFSKKISNKVPLNIHAAMWSGNIPQGYYLYPRSSISKTPMRLANSTGIIDKGYRGPLTTMIDIIDYQLSNYSINALDRYFQICHPSLNFFKVIMVDNLDDLGITERGAGGFGSTG